MRELDTIGSIPPPSASRGDVAMLARVEQSLFGESQIQAQHIGHYEILERLGSGGMGVVYAAYDPKLERKIALKLLRRGVLAERGRDRLLAEARALAKLSHPNVVQVHGVDVHDGEVYVVMELVDGSNLSVWQREPRSVRERLAVYLDAGAGLAAAHAAGIVHRDFKPANVLLGRGGVVKVADFGLASSVEFDTNVDSDSTRSTPNLVGTRGYIAPELWNGHPADALSDQFAFCVSLWEAMVGELPFAKTATPSDAPRGVWRGPRWLRRVLVRGMQLDPSMRWPSMDVLLARLRDTPRRRRMVGAGAMGLGAITGLMFVLPERSNMDACIDVDDDQVWSTDQLDALSLKLARSDEPGADASVVALIGELEAHQRRWDDARQQLCEDHYEAGTRSAAGFDRGQACLARSRARTLVIRDALTDDSSLSEAWQLIEELDHPQGCLDPSLAGNQATLAASSTVEALVGERQLASLRVAIARGQLDVAQSRARALSQWPGDTGTEALLLLGRVQRDAGERDEARKSLLSANRRAVLARSDGLAFDAQRMLSELAALEYTNALDARSWLNQAETTLLALGHPIHDGLELRYTKALVHGVEGHPELAAEHLRELVDGLVATDAEPRDVNRARLALANAIAAAGDHAEAMRIHTSLLDDEARRLGPGHPSVGILAFDIADTLVQIEDWDAALPMLERALTIETRAYGPRSVRVSEVQTRLAEVEVERGNLERAIELADAAWTTQTRALKLTDENFGAPLVVLAWANLQAERWAEAEESYRELLVTLELDDEDRAGAHQSLAWISCRREPRCQGARAELERVRELAAPGSLILLRAQVVEADIALLDDSAALARDRALAVLEQLSRLEPDIDLETEAEAEALAGIASAQLGEVVAAREHFSNASALAEYLVDDLEARCARAVASFSKQDQQHP